MNTPPNTSAAVDAVPSGWRELEESEKQKQALPVAQCWSYGTKAWCGKPRAMCALPGYRIIVPLTPAPAEDGWIEWGGGECPVGLKENIMWKCRGHSKETGPGEAGIRHWQHGPVPAAYDIIAYRIVTPVKETVVEKPSPWYPKTAGEKYRLRPKRGDYWTESCRAGDTADSYYINQIAAGWEFEPLDVIVAKPQWRLPDPPAGREWYRTDWTEEMLPEKEMRPLLSGEIVEPNDEYLVPGHPWGWSAGGSCSRPNQFHYRTTRPLPAPAPTPAAVDPWFPKEGELYQYQIAGKGNWYDGPRSGGGKESHCRSMIAQGTLYRPWPKIAAVPEDPYKHLKEAHAAGKVIEWRWRKPGDEWTDWHSRPLGYSFAPSDSMFEREYRVAPEPTYTARVDKAAGTVSTEEFDNRINALAKMIADATKAAEKSDTETKTQQPNEPNNMAHLDNTQMFANAGAINSERATAAPEIELPEVGSKWVFRLNGNAASNSAELEIVAVAFDGIAIQQKGRKTTDLLTVKEWSDASKTEVISRKQLRRQRKADARLDREVLGVRNRSAVNYVTFTGRKSLPKRIFKYVLSRSGWYTLGGLTGHLAASAILSGVAYLASLWAQYIVTK